jgi:hypothetical protein
MNRDSKPSGGEGGCACESPDITSVRVSGGLLLKSYAFVISPVPCCAQGALPFWAKAMGTIVNNEVDETYVKVTARLLNRDQGPIGEYAEFMIIDGMGSGEFDVKITEFLRDTQTFHLEIEKVSGLSEFE